MLINDIYVLNISRRSIGESGMEDVSVELISWTEIERLIEVEENVVSAVAVSVGQCNRSDGQLRSENSLDVNS